MYSQYNVDINLCALVTFFRQKKYIIILAGSSWQFLFDAVMFGCGRVSGKNNRCLILL